MNYTNENFYYNDKYYKRVNKTIARKAFKNNKEVFLQSCNMVFNNIWQAPCNIKKENNDTKFYVQEKFDNIVNNYSYYNCDNERGYYPSYYIEIK